MLPEIFTSIVDTRKADRAIDKRHSRSANKDVLKLYLKINGSNKKLVNYLLKNVRLIILVCLKLRILLQS